MMDKNRKPFVVLEQFDFNSSSDVKQFNSRNDDHKLYVNMSRNSESVYDEDQREKKFYLKKSSQKVVRNGDSPSKRVSFSNHSRVMYFNEDTSTLCSSLLVDNVVPTSEEPIVKPPSDTESKYPEVTPENKQLHPLEKDLVIVLEKLPVDLVKEVQNENCDQRKCFQSVTHCSDSQNFNESFDLQSTESQVSELTEGSETILSDDEQKLKTNLSQFETFSTDSSADLNASLHQELKVSIQRLPDHLLEPYLSNNSLKSSEGNLNISKQEDSYENDLSQTENKVDVKLINISLLPCSTINIDVESSNPTLSEPLKQESCQHENSVCNCDVLITNSCVLNEALNADVSSSYSIPSEPRLKQESCENENSVYNCDVSVRNPCVLNETLNGDVDSSHCSTPSKPLKQESLEPGKVDNSDVSVRNPCVLNEELNGDVDSSHCSTPSKPLKQESLEPGKVDNSDVSVMNPCVLIEALNGDVNSSHCSTPNEPLKQESLEPGKVDNSDVSIRNPCVLIEALNGDVNSSYSTPNVPLQQKSSEPVNNVYNKDVLIRNPCVLNEALSEDVNSSISTPNESLKEKSYEPVNNVYNNDVPMKNPYVLIERLNLIVPKIDSIQSTKKSQKRKKSKKYIHCDESDDINGNLMETESNTVLDNTDKPLLGSSKLSKASKRKKKSQTLKSGNGGKNPRCLSHQIKASSKKSKSHTQVRNKTDIPLDDIYFPSHKITKIIPVDSRHNLSCTTNEMKQCDLSLTKTKKYSSTEHQSSTYNNSSSEDDIALSSLSKPNQLSNFSSSEDDMPLSVLHKGNKDKQTKTSGHIKKKKKRSQKSKTSEMQKFTDFNVMHMAEIIPSNSLTFMSDFKKKAKKTSMKKIERKESKKEMLLFSHLNMDNGKQSKILDCIEKEKKKSQKSITNGMQKFPDFNVMHVAKIMPSNSLTFTSDFKKKGKQTPSMKKIKRKKPSKKKLLFSRLSEMDALEFFSQVKESNLKKPIKTGAKKCNNKLFLLSKQTKLNYIKGPTLVGHEAQASNYKTNSALSLNNIPGNCYYETVELDSDSDLSPPPLKKVKLNNYNLSCNMCKASKKKSIAVPTENNVTVTKKSRKKKDCQSKKKETSNELHITLRNYLNKFFTEFDSLGVSKKYGVGFSRKENEFIKKKENIYKMLISEMHNHLKNTCSIKKSFKRQRLKEKLSKRSLPHIKVEPEDDLPSKPTRPKGKKRKLNKENHIDKFRLGFLTGDKFLGLYNRCVAAERLILKKYKMKKQQRQKIKRFFKTLKKNSLRRSRG